MHAKVELLKAFYVVSLRRMFCLLKNHHDEPLEAQRHSHGLPQFHHHP